MSRAIQHIYDKYCTTRFPLPTSEQIGHFMDTFGVSLPESYVRFLAEFNGGYFRDPTIQLDVPEAPKDALSVLAGIGTSAESGELGFGMWDPYWLDENDPIQLLPIGYTVMGNQIFMIVDPAGDDFGNIAIALKFSNKAFPAGDNFDEFFGRLV